MRPILKDIVLGVNDLNFINGLQACLDSWTDIKQQA